MSEPIILGTVIRADVPEDGTGALYPKAVLEQAVAKLSAAYPDGIPGTIGNTPGPMSLSEVSHLAKAPRLREDGAVVAEIEVLTTPQGKVLLGMLDPKNLRLTMRGSCTLRERVVTNLMLDRLDVTPYTDARSNEKCPFCGKRAVELQLEEGHEHVKAWVACWNCSASGPVNSADDADRAWAEWDEGFRNPKLPSL